MELFCDLETENVEYRGQKASPFCPQNYIVAPGWALGDGCINHEYFYSRGEADESNWAERALSEATIFVAHNATFEIHWMMHRHYRPFMDFLKRGGRVFCTQMAEYIITHQTHTYPSLEECSVKYGGTKKIDEVKLLWEQGYLTSQIEESLLLRYLVDEREGDIANTRLVYYNQMSELVHHGMIDMAWWRMDALLFNAISTFNGLYVDRPTADKNHAEQLARVQELRAELQGYLPADLPDEFEFNYGSDFHMSALLFGGPIKYDKKVSYEPKKYEKADFYRFGTKYIPVTDCTPAKFGEYENLYGWVDVYKAGKNKGSPKVHSLETDVEKLKWGEDYYTFEGLISFSDLPTHVSDLYLSKRAEFRGKRTLADDVTPVYSTSKDSLDILSKFTDVAKPVTELAQLEKDNGTYYIAHELNAKGEIKKTKGMLQYVGEDSIIHHQLNGTSTITGRLSSSNPNLQNLPRDGTSRVKEMFSSRFGLNGRVVEVDYTALEVVTLAAASGDKALLQNLQEGIDMHCYRLAGAMGESYETVLRKAKDENDPEHKKYKQLRIDIKPRAFAAQYGASAAGISFATGCTLQEAEDFLATEAKLFPESIEIRGTIRDMVERTGSEPMALHREMLDSGQWSVYRRGFFQAPSGSCYSFRQYPQWRDGQNVMDYKDTQIANYWCQGEASLIVQVACGLVVRWLIENEFFEGNVLCINTVHDAIYLDCATEEWANYAGKAVQQIMEYAPQYMAEVVPALRDWRYHEVPFPAAAEQGPNMYAKTHIH